ASFKFQWLFRVEFPREGVLAAERRRCEREADAGDADQNVFEHRGDSLRAAGCYQLVRQESGTGANGAGPKSSTRKTAINFSAFCRKMLLYRARSRGLERFPAGGPGCAARCGFR